MATRLGFLDPGAGPFQVVTSGGLWEGLRACAHASAPSCGKGAGGAGDGPRETPAAGAVRLALQAAGLLDLDPTGAPSGQPGEGERG